jgi:hypothetical protein
MKDINMFIWFSCPFLYKTPLSAHSHSIHISDYVKQKERVVDGRR